MGQAEATTAEAEAEAAEEEEQEEGFRVVGLAGEGAQKKEDDGDADALTTAARDVQQDAAPHSLARSVRSTRSAQPSRGVSIGTAEAAAGLSLLKRASIGWGEAPSPFTPTPYAARRRRGAPRAARVVWQGGGWRKVH